MVGEDSEPSMVDGLLNSAAPENLHVFPSSDGVADAGPQKSSSCFRLFNRERSMHQVLGGGKSADVMLWREKYISAGILIGATLAWILLEKSGYSLLTIVSNVLLLLIVGLFIWANAASFINKPPPRIPELHLSEDMVISFASALRVEINKALAIAHDIALGKDLKIFLKVVAILWGLSIVGGWFHFLTLIYICVVLSHTIPVIYQRYEDQVDAYLKLAMDEAHKHYRTISDLVAKNLPKAGFKEKKRH